MSNIKFTQDDYYLWMGKLYVEKMQFERAANELSVELEKSLKKKKGKKNDKV